MAQDYYKTLGIDKTASASEIKKAYRKLALKYHPDKTKGDKALEDKFKGISEAYAVLSDENKKKQYDTYGSADFQQKYSQEDIFRNADLGDILKEFGFGGGGGFSSTFGQGGARGSFSGRGGNPFSQNARSGAGGGCRAPARGKDLEYEIPLTIDELINGAGKTITISQNGQTKAIEVKIPKGLTQGKKIRLAGKGESGTHGGPCGNLYIKSSPSLPQGITVEGNDILMTKDIRLTQALIGDKVEVNTPSGKTINLTLPPGTGHKAKMRLPGMGVPQMKGNGCGDLYVVVNIVLPKILDEKQQKLIKELKETGL